MRDRKASAQMFSAGPPSRGPAPASPSTGLATDLGNQAMSERIARSPAPTGAPGDTQPGATAFLRPLAPPTVRGGALARQTIARDPLHPELDAGTATVAPPSGDAGTTAGPAADTGAPVAALPTGAPPVPAGLETGTPVQTPGLAPAGGDATTGNPPQTRDQVVAGAIGGVLEQYQHLHVQVPATRPAAPSRRRRHADPAPTQATDATDAAAQPTSVEFSTPYFINHAGGGDASATGGAHDLSASGVSTWFHGLPSNVRNGKGTPEQIQTAMQQAVDAGLIPGTWPPDGERLKTWMNSVGLGVDCSGFVYHALMSAGSALTGAGMSGLTHAQRTTVGNTGSQQLGATGGTQITSPTELAVGDIVQMAPDAGHPVGHVRIITAVRTSGEYVEYDTAESTTRVGDGPQSSTWRIPAAGPMDSRHLEVRNGDTWTRESTGRPSSYWRRLATTGAATDTPTPSATD